LFGGKARAPPEEILNKKNLQQTFLWCC